uniref:Uncharacterized protein n=1 Tax=Oryzias latipes TaxID=8090 RepID=A0A3P9HZN3_ORYLA
MGREIPPFFSAEMITSTNDTRKNPNTTTVVRCLECYRKSLHSTLTCVSSDALSEPEICYVLDGILFLYGIILTALYCRIKILSAREAKGAKGGQNVEEGIYTGLTPHATDTYETIGMKK